MLIRYRQTSFNITSDISRHDIVDINRMYKSIPYFQLCSVLPVLSANKDFPLFHKKHQKSYKIMKRIHSSLNDKIMFPK